MQFATSAAAAALTVPLAFSVPTFAEPLYTPRVEVGFTQFGMHAISAESSGVLGMGTVRLWDTDTTWRVINPARGVYRWDTLDARIQAAVDSGTTVLMVLGGTPAWAAKSLSHSDAAWLGPGSASPPRSLADWADFVGAVAQRYGGRIEAYQVWNEPSDPIFWRGSWDILARMTNVAEDVVYRYDSGAEIVAAPIIPRGPNWRADARDYIDALAEQGLPVDVMSFHGYSAGPPGPASSKPIRRLQRLLASSPAAGLPLWETEVNFTSASRRSTLPNATERSWLARVYLDAIRLGVERVYWYAYAAVPEHLAIDIRKESVAPAFAAVSSWMAGATFDGCSDSWQGQRGVTGCAFVDSSGRTGVSLWADTPRVVTPGRGTAYDLRGRSWSVVSALAVHHAPVWFRPSEFPG